MDTYQKVLEPRPPDGEGFGFLLFIRNSLIVATATVILTLAVGILAAYSAARLNFFGRKAVSFGMILIYLFPVVVVGLTLAYTVALRTQEGELGEDLIVLLLVCVTFSDTGAFYVGSAIGRRRMAPRLSPNKSWEGAIGGLAAAVGGGLLAHYWFFQSRKIYGCQNGISRKKSNYRMWRWRLYDEFTRD